MPTTTSEIIGIIGAAAWLPQIGGWIYSAFSRPKIDLVPAPLPQVGYTCLGPIFNLTCAISASRKDAIISKMTANLRHETGRTLAFSWKTLNETFSNIRSTTGETAEVTKNQPAVALKVSTLALSEKMVGFQDQGFQNETMKLFIAVDEQKAYLDKTDSNAKESILKSKQFFDLIDYFKRNCVWQEGRYDVLLKITIIGVKTPAEANFFFVLSKADATRLDENVQYIQEHFIDRLNPPLKLPKDYAWHWANPAITV